MCERLGTVRQSTGCSWVACRGINYTDHSKPQNRKMVKNHKGTSKGHSANAMHYFTTKYFSAMCKSLERWHKSPAHAKNHHFQFFSVEKASPGEEMWSSAIWLLSTILKYSLHLAAPSETTTIFFVVTKKCDILFFQWLQHKNQIFPITVCSTKMVWELRSCKLPFHY